MTKNDQKCWSPPRFEPGSFQKPKKVRIFVESFTTEPRRRSINWEQNIVTELVNSNLYLIDMKHYLNLTLKLFKVVFSDKQITEIKKKMHIDPILTYSDPEIALKVCKNKLRFKFNRRPLWTESYSKINQVPTLPFNFLN